MAMVTLIAGFDNDNDDVFFIYLSTYVATESKSEINTAMAVLVCWTLHRKFEWNLCR